MIRISNLSVSYDKVVIAGFDFTFENGIYCIFAPSGTGKTTLLNAIAGLVKFSGEIVTEGNISYLFQEDRLLNWLTARENIMLVEPDKAVAERLIDLFDIRSFENKKPEELSGGMKRRCALARCLSFAADIYLLDEPFRGLDDVNAELVRGYIIEQAKTKMFIVVTHDENDIIKLNAQKILL